MNTLIFDIETNGLLDQMDRIHIINAYEVETGISYTFTDSREFPRTGNILDGVAMLVSAGKLIGHNIIGFDIPALAKIHPAYDWYSIPVEDTLVMSRVMFTNLMDKDMAAIARGKLPLEFRNKGLIGSHGLKAWGMRLGVMKDDYDGGWEALTQEMYDYSLQDVVVSTELYNHFKSKGYSQECLDLEHRVAQIIERQRQWGFAFDVKAAEALTQKLQVRHAQIAAELQVVFPPWQESTGTFIPKVNNKAKGYVKGQPIERFKDMVFNPASRDHIANRLIALRKWKPSVFTEGGKPQVDESTLNALPWPEAKLLSEYLMVEKRLGQLAQGKEAWLKHVKVGPRGARIHGTVNTNGAVTGRMTHGKPNVAQTPSCGAPYGPECRSLFTVTDKSKHALVGCDAEGLELRCLAHFMARWDNGAYAETVVNGKKEDGTDVHTVNQKAAGLNTRDAAKTFIYALIYGAGDHKLGSVCYDDFTDEVKRRWQEKNRTDDQKDAALRRLGKSRRDSIMQKLPALGKLVEAVKTAVKARGFLKGLDGRLLHVRSEHAALNTLLQSAGAVAMKRALILFDAQVAAYRSQGAVVEPVANIHDEVQIECTKEIADDIGKLAAASIAAAGDLYGFRCPLAGSYNVGATWQATH